MDLEDSGDDARTQTPRYPRSQLVSRGGTRQLHNTVQVSSQDQRDVGGLGIHQSGCKLRGSGVGAFGQGRVHGRVQGS